MNFQLFAVPYKYVGTDKKEHTSYNFFIVSENGNIQRINHHSYKDGDKYYSNRDILMAFANKVANYDKIEYKN